MNKAEKLRALAMMRQIVLREGLGRTRRVRPATAGALEGQDNDLTRRDFLRGAAGGALSLAALPALGALAGCGSGSGNLENPGVITPGTRLLVSTFLEGTVETLDARSGQTVGTFFPRINSDITTAGVRRGPGDRVYVFSPGANRFYICDVNTGAVKREVLLPQTQTPHCGSIGPDGNLYVVNAPSLNNRLGIGPDSIEIFTPDGDRIRTFISTETVPEVRSPFGIAWGPDGNLYVTSVLAYNPFPLNSDYVARFDGQTGRFLGYVARDVKVPFNINFHPEGYLLVIEHFFGRVVLYELSTGKIKDAFANSDFCIDAVFGPDGHLYMSSFTDLAGIEAIFNFDNEAAKGRGRILRFDGKNGEPLGALRENLVFSGYLAFV
ncbi:MAG TPA: hypothetical protein VM490_08400 [Armatimonadaceae bacterium]|nr:hypothetical protein [Armatimonadaceae bacterium]